MRDFTNAIYCKLLNELKIAGYGFVTFDEYIGKRKTGQRLIILRHDVDKNPFRSFQAAQLENELGIKGNYYFRIVKNQLPSETIEQIAALGHEIGYHYDDLNDAGGNVVKALELFRKNLAKMRELAPVKTACMHGSPMSMFDNRALWKHADYREFGIIGEPYLDIDFNRVLYLTDTGRRWDGEAVSIRDKVRGEGLEVRGQRSEVRKQKSDDRRGEEHKRPRIHSTNDIINAIRNNQLPEQIMLTLHPQRWSDEWGPWVWELVSQKVKNVVKYFIVKCR